MSYDATRLGVASIDLDSTPLGGSDEIFPSNRVRIMTATKPVDFPKGMTDWRRW
ncbi:hypothetical protein HFO16_33035 [Rhizobium laguerreae]|uniref:hypothetical protein n=1 Tax=Rhizobium laguerreae TaxID=1076926 RepID=UPI001C91CF2D|nr:hypothetical protein [Rhizobium laguerreae]MBY3246137.1 hypothetical protein [Rhizobium laguerreae]MBY3252784.1 hypothetical protein [Rhizobium laguerreae]